MELPLGSISNFTLRPRHDHGYIRELFLRNKQKYFVLYRARKKFNVGVYNTLFWTVCFNIIIFLKQKAIPYVSK